MRSSHSMLAVIAGIGLLLGSTVEAAAPDPQVSPSPASGQVRSAELFPASIDGQSIDARYSSGADWVSRVALSDAERAGTTQRTGDALSFLGRAFPA